MGSVFTNFSINWEKYNENYRNYKPGSVVYITDWDAYVYHYENGKRVIKHKNYSTIPSNISSVYEMEGIQGLLPGIYTHEENDKISLYYYNGANFELISAGSGGTNNSTTSTAIKEISFTASDFVDGTNNRSYFTIFPATHGFGKSVKVMEVVKELTDSEEEGTYYEPIVCQVRVLGTGVIKVFVSKNLVTGKSFNGKVCLIKTGG